jgi:hypothetical protein
MALTAIAVLAVLLALFILQLLHIISAYKVATGTPWQRFLAAFSHSETVLLARVGAFVSAAIAVGIDMLPTLDPDSSVGQKIAAIIPPQYAPVYMMIFALLIEMVRRRRSSIDPITPPRMQVIVPPAPPVEVVAPATVLVPADPATPAAT